MGLLLPGEYDQVTRATADLEALRDAHRTPCTRAEASALLDYLSAQYGIANLEKRFGSNHGRASHGPKWVTEVRAYEVFSGRVTRRRRVYLRDSDNRCVMYLRVSLPKSPTYGTGLRIGLVLHEFAHILNQVFDGGMRRCGHGPMFVSRFDALIAAWRQRAGRIAA